MRARACLKLPRELCRAGFLPVSGVWIATGLRFRVLGFAGLEFKVLGFPNVRGAS